MYFKEVYTMGLRSFFYKLTHRRKAYDEGEVEDITSALIEETRYAIKERFNQEIAEIKKHGRKLTEDEARTILMGLLYEAISRRKLLAGRIEKSVEVGTLFERYYGKMQAINYLTNKAYSEMQKMNVAKERYEFQRGIYHKLTGKMYVPDTIPDDTPTEKHGEKYKDVWEKIDDELKIFEEGE